MLRPVDGGCEVRGLVEGRVLEHAVDDVAALMDKTDGGVVVAFAFVAFALVVGVAFEIVERGNERGLPEGVLEAFVASPCRMLATYAAASSGDGCDARVGGQMGSAVEPGDIAIDCQKDLACGPDRDSGHAGRDCEKGVILQKGLDLVGELFALFAQLADAGGEYGDDLLDGLGAGHGHTLLTDGVETGRR